MRRSFLLFICLLCILFTGVFVPGFTKDELDNSYTQSTSSYTNYRDCIKLYKLPFSKLYFLALSSVEANKYETLEMQSRNGYIIFKVDNREFLLSVMKKDKNYTFLKLTPCDNNYYFSPLIPQKIFNYINSHFNAEVKELKF